MKTTDKKVIITPENLTAKVFDPFFGTCEKVNLLTKRRKGRGNSSGRGQTCGRGSKGAYARNTVNKNLEGGQTPLHRRVAKFGEARWRVNEVKEVSLLQIENLIKKSQKTEMSSQDILSLLDCPKRFKKVKVIMGKRPIIISNLQLSVEKISASAKEIIEKNNGKVNLI